MGRVYDAAAALCLYPEANEFTRIWAPRIVGVVIQQRVVAQVLGPA